MQEQHKKQPEISIIVPVYKTERFLSACISSILAQTFTDFELILVDDGSPDSCPALCDAAAAKDSRIRVIHQKNRGLSGARNAGLDAAEGEWIAFVDSDDTITPDFCAKLYHAAQEAGAQMAVCNYRQVDEAMTPIRALRRSSAVRCIPTSIRECSSAQYSSHSESVMPWRRTHSNTV